MKDQSLFYFHGFWFYSYLFLNTMTLLQAILLGIIQGLTEFLPISSSGHLTLAEGWMGIGQHDISFEVFVHFGTLLAVITIFWNDLKRVIIAFFQALFSLGNLEDVKTHWRTNVDFRLGIYLMIGTIPAGMIGILFEKQVEESFSHPFSISIQMIITGLILFTTKLVKNENEPNTGLKSFLIGIAQAIAIIPAISRSGATITTGILLKMPREEAGRFSFLLSVPVILGAVILKTKDLIRQPPPGHELTTLIAATVVSAIFGYLAIKWLFYVLKKDRFIWFGIYCVILGTVAAFLTY